MVTRLGKIVRTLVTPMPSIQLTEARKYADHTVQKLLDKYRRRIMVPSYST